MDGDLVVFFFLSFSFFSPGGGSGFPVSIVINTVWLFCATWDGCLSFFLPPLHVEDLFFFEVSTHRPRNFLPPCSSCPQQAVAPFPLFDQLSRGVQTNDFPLSVSLGGTILFSFLWVFVARNLPPFPPFFPFVGCRFLRLHGQATLSPLGRGSEFSPSVFSNKVLSPLFLQVIPGSAPVPSKTGAWTPPMLLRREFFIPRTRSSPPFNYTPRR